MIVGIIDLGTNTFNLLIAEVKKETTNTLFKTKIPVKLGQGGLDKSIISEEAFVRGLTALTQHKESLLKYEVDKVYAFATSGIRSTKNGKDFVASVKNELNIDVKIISGDEEAELIYEGVKEAINLPEGNSLIVDIGGGSTEFIVASCDGILWKRSFQLGVSRIKENFKPSDPILVEQIQTLKAFLLTELKPLFEALKLYPCDVLIGSSGSFDSFADMILHRQKTPNLLEGENNYQFNIQELLSFNEEIKSSSYSERLAIPGLIEMRADMIVLAGLFTEFLIDEIKPKQIFLSKYALKEGALATVAKEL